MNICYSLIGRQERLKFRLGKSSKSVIAINDGSIVIDYSIHPGRVATWGINGGGRVIKPVVSIEVCFFLFISNLSQAKRKREKGTQADWRHAGQIFCEMLGQLCHPEIYAMDPDEFLEVRHPHMILIWIGIHNTCPTYRSPFVLLQIPGILSPQCSKIWSTLQESSLNCTGRPSSTYKKLSAS
jgi:hypothetical protein